MMEKNSGDVASIYRGRPPGAMHFQSRDIFSGQDFNDFGKVCAWSPSSIDGSLPRNPSPYQCSPCWPLYSEELQLVRIRSVVEANAFAKLVPITVISLVILHEQTGVEYKDAKQQMSATEGKQMNGESGSAYLRTKFTSQAASKRRVCTWYL
jgi:hypothetical protein